MHDWHFSIKEVRNFPVRVSMNGGSMRFDIDQGKARELAMFLVYRMDVQDRSAQQHVAGAATLRLLDGGWQRLCPSRVRGAPRVLLSEDSAKRLGAAILLKLSLLEPANVAPHGGDPLAGTKKKTDDNLRRVFG